MLKLNKNQHNCKTTRFLAPSEFMKKHLKMFSWIKIVFLIDDNSMYYFFFYTHEIIVIIQACYYLFFNKRRHVRTRFRYKNITLTWKEITYHYIRNIYSLEELFLIIVLNNYIYFIITCTKSKTIFFKL